MEVGSPEVGSPLDEEDMEVGTPLEEDDREVGTPRREDIDVHKEVARMIDFDVEDNLRTPEAQEKVIYDEGGPSLIGLRFETEEDAYEHYNDHAKSKGFGIRKEYRKKCANGKVKSRKFCCSREGHRRKDKRDDKVKRQRYSTRVDCMAHIFIKLDTDGIYIVVRHETIHNHLCTPKKGYMCRSQRHIPTTQAMKGDLVDSVGIRPKATFDLMSAEVGGAKNLGFLSVDYKNYLKSKRMSAMIKGDAAGVLEYLEKMAMDDLGSIYRIQLDEGDKIANIFWADSNMVIDYEAFGDVVCFDTTYRTNNYLRPFAPFVGVNNHRQSIVFGVALMYDETIPSFEFVFKAFLDAMSGKVPITILTDQDKAMTRAISEVMPNTYNRICVWHMHQNALKHLDYLYTDTKTFKEDFNKCIYEYEEEVEFLDAWERMLEKYNLQDNYWVQTIFEERKKVGSSIWKEYILCTDDEYTTK